MGRLQMTDHGNQFASRVSMKNKIISIVNVSANVECVFWFKFYNFIELLCMLTCVKSLHLLSLNN